ncbi:response regulator [Rhodobacterales bacterium HKCCE3408]|nr:response regulator [Rhodobacterales bacterium HKCCE3408]
MTVSAPGELERRPVADSRPAGPRRLSVLILDDEAADRMRLVRLMRQAGLQIDVTEVAEVEGFGPALDAASYDLVFIDYWLGLENGLDALALLAAHDGQAMAAAIMLTGATDPEVIVEAMRSGCVDYIVKAHLDVGTLRACIATAFERRVMSAAMREGNDLRAAIRRLVERLARGRVPGLSEAPAGFTGPSGPSTLERPAARRLSAGLLQDLELLWHLRQEGGD